MFREVALVTVACVLFVQMGLSEAIQNVLRIHLTIASCPKCLTMWSTLAVLVLHGYGVLESVAASFLASYSAVWLALLYDALAVLYNSIYETITPNTGTGPDAAPRAHADAPGGPASVS